MYLKKIWWKWCVKEFHLEKRLYDYIIERVKNYLVINMEKEMKVRIREITAALRKYGFGKVVNRTIKEKIFPSKDDEYDIFLDP